MNLTGVGQAEMLWGVISAKLIPNWEQRVELKLQAISFIHIKLGKVAKCAKLIRLIDFFSPASACVCPPFGHDIDLCRIITFPDAAGILILSLQSRPIRVNGYTNTSMHQKLIVSQKRERNRFEEKLLQLYFLYILMNTQHCTNLDF